VITPGKRWRPPEPEEGVVEHMPEPTKPKLRELRDQLAARADTLPPELYQALQGLIWWAAWRLDRLLTTDQIRYQRAYVVREFIRRYIAKYGKTRGSREYAYRETAMVLTGPYAGSPRAMREAFLVEESAPDDDPRSVRRRETLERRAREADKKRVQRQRRKR
jgi:hypothetical protein